MGPQSSGQARPSKQVVLPPELAAVALVDVRTCIAPGGMSESWWHDGVRRTRDGELEPHEVPFPQPVIRQPRFTRWQLQAVARFWAELAERATHDTRVLDQAKKAAGAAQAKRRETEKEGA